MAGTGADDGGRPLGQITLAIGALALVLRLWAPGPVTQTVDEPLWLIRSEAFRNAIVDGDLARATASRQGELATMPGVTTMWAGTLGRELARVTGALGLSAPVESRWAASPQVLRAGRAVVALGSSLALAVAVVAAARLLGRRAAVVAGVVMATEPFLIGHAGVLHTDSLVTHLGAAAVLCGAVAGQHALARLGLAPVGGARSEEDGAGDETGVGAGPGRGRAERVGSGAGRAWAVTAGVAAGLSVLTKINAGVLVGGGAVVLSVALTVEVARRDRGLLRAWAREWGARAGQATAAALATVVALWPALWVAPGEQIRLLGRSATQVGDPSSPFYAGKAVAEPALSFVPVTLAYRLTPWLLAGSVLVLAALAVRAGLRWAGRGAAQVPWGPGWLGVTLLGTGSLYLAGVLASAKKYDRYSLPVVPLLALAVGGGVAALVRVALARGVPGRAVAGAGAAVTVVLAGHALVQAPYAISYANSALGGQRGAEEVIMLGWSEGVERVGAEVARREGEDCPSVRTVFQWHLAVAMPCGRIVPWYVGMPVELDDVDYVVISVTMRQRDLAGPFDEALAERGATLVHEARIGGVTYAELWALDRPG